MLPGLAEPQPFCLLPSGSFLCKPSIRAYISLPPLQPSFLVCTYLLLALCLSFLFPLLLWF